MHKYKNIVANRRKVLEELSDLLKNTDRKMAEIRDQSKEDTALYDAMDVCLLANMSISLFIEDLYADARPPFAKAVKKQ